jgi:hypothetical protein
MKRYVFDETKLDAVIRAAYDLSRPQGLGFLHATDGPLDDATLEAIKTRESGRCAAGMDYVRGRSIKLTVHRDGDKLYIPADRWYDHSPEALHELATRAGLGEPIEVSDEC